MIRTMADQGMTGREIASFLNRRLASIYSIARQFQIPLALSGGKRRVGAFVSRGTVDVLDALAASAKISRGAMIERLLRESLADGGKTARRVLGKHALPKRPYTRRVEAQAS